LLGGTALLLFGAGGLALKRGHHRAHPSRPLRVLDAATYASLTSLAERIVPGEGATGWPSATDLDCAGAIDGVLASLHPADAKDFVRFVGLLDNGLFSLLTAGSFTCYADLSAAEQDARLQAWSRSHLAVVRSGLVALKRLVHATYYASPVTYAHVGYPGPPEIGGATAGGRP